MLLISGIFLLSSSNLANILKKVTAHLYFSKGIGTKVKYFKLIIKIPTVYSLIYCKSEVFSKHLSSAVDFNQIFLIGFWLAVKLQEFNYNF